MHLDPKEALFQSLQERFGTAQKAASWTSPQKEAGHDEALHPPETLLQAHRQGWVSGPLRDDLRLHLGSCSFCRARFAELHLEALSEEHSTPQDTDRPIEANAETPGEALHDVDTQSGVAIQTFDEAEVSDHREAKEPAEAPAIAAPSSAAVGATPMLSHWWSIPASLGALGLALWLVVPAILPPTTSPTPPKPFSGLKGKRPQWTKGIEQLYADFATRALLHLGVVDGPGLPVRRLHRDSPCHRRQSLFFGFSLARPGGYVYLFRIDPRGQAAPELLYPFTQAKAIHKDGGAVHIVERAGVTQRYPLEHEGRDVLFVLLQRNTPLKTSQLQALLKHKTGWDDQLSVLRQQGLRGSGSFDRFLVRMQARPQPGETP